MAEHCVRVVLELAGGDQGDTEERDAVFQLGEELEATIEQAKSGEFDGHEFGGGRCVLYMYGPDADRLMESIQTIFRSSWLCKNGILTRRYGPPQEGVKEIATRLP